MTYSRAIRYGKTMDPRSVHLGALMLFVNALLASNMIAIFVLRLWASSISKRCEGTLLAVAVLLTTVDAIVLGLPLIDGLRRTTTLNIL